jgi:hypothetical protein
LVENIIFHQRFLTFAWKLGGWTKPFSCSCAKSLRLTPWKCDLWQLGRDVCTGLFVPASRMGSGKHVEVRPSLAWTILRRYSALFHSPILGSLCQRSTGTHLCAICPCHSKFETPLYGSCVAVPGESRRTCARTTFVAWGRIRWHFARGASLSCEG